MKQRIAHVFGWALLAGLWLGPLRAAAQTSFAAHMTLHMGVVAVVAPLLALGIAGTALDPVQRAPAWFPPVPLSIVELVIVWGWHAPALHQAARHTPLGLAAEQVSFLVAGVLVWLAALGGSPGQRRARAGAGITALLLTSMHMTLLGALLALSPRVLYPHHGHTLDPTALEDQHLGGAIMLLAGGIAYLVGGLGLTAGLLRSRQPAQEEPR